MKGIIRIAAATPRLHLGDPRANVTELVRLASAVSADGAAAIVFPELCLTGYTCGDLFFRSDLLSAAESALADFAAATAKLPIIAIVGFPQREGDLIRNAAAVVYGGAIVGVVCKRILPTYAEYYERRQFTPAPSDEPLKVFDAGSFRFGVEICEDLWAPVPPSARMASRGVDVIFNLSASTDFLGKALRRQDMVRQQSARLVCAYAMACAGTGESSADAVFGGGSLIAVNGAVATASKLFCADSSLVMTDVDIESLRFRRRSESSHQEQVDLPPPHLVPLAAELPSATPRAVSPSPFLDEYGEEGWHRKILTIQATALARRMESAHVRKLVIGVSGGADSALALLGAAAALDRQGLPRNHLLAVVMPGFGSTGRTQGTAAALSRAVGATLRTVDICAACHRHLSDIGHPEDVHDIAYENVQARERTQVLMDLANMENALVVGTGDLSEIALGWNTYSGDHMSMYQLNCSVRWYWERCGMSRRSRMKRCARSSTESRIHRLRQNSSPMPLPTTAKRGSVLTSSTTSSFSTTSRTVQMPKSCSRSRALPSRNPIVTRPSSRRATPSSAASGSRSTSETAFLMARRSRFRSPPAPTGACRVTSR